MIYIDGIKWVIDNDARLNSDQQFNNTPVHTAPPPPPHPNTHTPPTHPLHLMQGKVGFAGVYIIFVFLLHNIDGWNSSEPPHFV